jgi:parallel beta-helix repeat protein
MKILNRRIGLALLTSTCLAWGASNALANHPVLVEGEKDFDGDGLIGLAEDTDDPNDRVFGTLNAALAAAFGGAAQNGRITIVTSGRFAEQLFINGTNGNVTVEAAPGVEANIDAVVAGARGATFTVGNNASRQEVPGIVIDAASNRRITLRNLVIRNWSEGVTVLNDSHVTLDKCRLEGNRDYGIRVVGNARVTISGCQVNGTGFRVGAATNNVANPGNGIEFQQSSSGLVCDSVITGSFGAGLKNSAKKSSSVRSRDNCLFDNNPDIRREKPDDDDDDD